MVSIPDRGKLDFNKITQFNKCVTGNEVICNPRPRAGFALTDIMLSNLLTVNVISQSTHWSNVIHYFIHPLNHSIQTQTNVEPFVCVANKWLIV
jgi:hypothetical protein